jgi:hypothetical protein
MISIFFQKTGGSHGHEIFFSNMKCFSIFCSNPSQIGMLPNDAKAHQSAVWVKGFFYYLALQAIKEPRSKWCY